MEYLIEIAQLLFGLVFLSDLVDTSNYPESSCLFSDTINITGFPRLKNGSYQYHNIIVPERYTKIYDKIFLYKNEERKVPTHTRACICKLKQCIKMCSGPNTARFMNKFEENIDSKNNIIEIMDSEIGFLRTISIIDYFAVQEGRPCQLLFQISPEDNYTIYKNGSLLLLNKNEFLEKDEYCLSSFGENKNRKSTVYPYSCFDFTERNFLDFLEINGKLLILLLIFF